MINFLHALSDLVQLFCDSLLGAVVGVLLLVAVISIGIFFTVNTALTSHQATLCSEPSPRFVESTFNKCDLVPGHGGSHLNIRDGGTEVWLTSEDWRWMAGR